MTLFHNDPGVNMPLRKLWINIDFHSLNLPDANGLTTGDAFVYMAVSHFRSWDALDSSDHKSHVVKS